MEYTYKITDMHTDDSKFEGFVCNVTMDMTATAEINGVSEKVSLRVDSKFIFDENQQYVDFASLNEDQVINWVLEQKGEYFINRNKTLLENDLLTKANINPIKSVELPWS